MLNNKKPKKSSFYEEKSLVGLTPDVKLKSYQTSQKVLTVLLNLTSFFFSPEIVFQVLFSVDVRKQLESTTSYVFRFPELHRDDEGARTSEREPLMVRDTTQNGAAVDQVKLRFNKNIIKQVSRQYCNIQF
jgi:hypothetical protein